MDRALSQLRDGRDRAARETLEFPGWKCSRALVGWAVETMLANSPQSTTALGWLLRQAEELPLRHPDREEATARVLDLSFAIATLAHAEADQNIVPFPTLSDGEPPGNDRLQRSS